MMGRSFWVTLGNSPRGDQHVAQCLGEFVGRRHRLREQVGALHDLLDDRPPLGGVAVEQRLTGVAAGREIELPHEIPRPRAIHS